MMASGAALLAIYAWHAGRTDHAILDLRLLKIRTFTASVIGGGFMRMGMGATPFLRPCCCRSPLAFRLPGRDDDLRQRSGRPGHEDLRGRRSWPGSAFRNHPLRKRRRSLVFFMGLCPLSTRYAHWLI